MFKAFIVFNKKLNKAKRSRAEALARDLVQKLNIVTGGAVRDQGACYGIMIEASSSDFKWRVGYGPGLATDSLRVATRHFGCHWVLAPAKRNQLVSQKAEKRCCRSSRGAAAAATAAAAEAAEKAARRAEKRQAIVKRKSMLCPGRNKRLHRDSEKMSNRTARRMSQLKISNEPDEVSNEPDQAHKTCKSFDPKKQDPGDGGAGGSNSWSSKACAGKIQSYFNKDA